MLTPEQKEQLRTDGTATASADYQSATGTLNFNPGETTKTLSVLILGYMVNEPNEMFFVTLSSPTNATLTRSQGA